MFAGACQDQHAGRPAPSLGWPGERKSIGATSRGKRRFSRAWGQGLGARAPKSLGPRPARQAKGWETADTAAAEVGVWREAGTGYTPPKVGGFRRQQNEKTQIPILPYMWKSHRPKPILHKLANFS